MDKTKTKFDYEIEAFEFAFSDKKELKMAIYGTGRMTATLLSRLQGFNIIGLLDRDSSLIGKEMYGVKIISREEAEKYADIVVINTTETYWNTIYKRIQDWKLPIYFRNGTRATEDFLHEDEHNPYWKKNYIDLEKKIQEYDIISFDIFDTLVMRKVYLPTDVFLIVEKKIQNKLGKDFSFVEVRKRAAGVLALEYATIDEIYEEIRETEGWSDELIEMVKECELDTEKQLIVPRRDMVKLYNIAKETKKVFFVSDMYLTANILEEILTQCGIVISKDKIIVSCDHKKTKEEGTLWKYYADSVVGGAKALHIGDNEKADGELPKQYGINSYIVWNAGKMLQVLFTGNITPDINSLYSSIAVGLISARLLNSPFALQRARGKLCFVNEEDAGFYLLGNIVYVFCSWLLKQTKENLVRKLAFFAREGYLLQKLFEFYCVLTGEKEKPETVYMETSRRAILGAAIWEEKDIFEVAEFPYMGNAKDFLYDRFGVSVDDNNLDGMICTHTTEEKSELKEILKKYKNDIIQESGKERQNYLLYMHSIGLFSDFSVVDSQLYGTTQYYLGKLLGEKLQGYYFCVCEDKTNRYLEKNIMSGCFPNKKGMDGEDSYIYKNAAFIEAFFTSPEGMLECIEDSGEKRYAEKKQNQIHYDVRFDMLNGIREFMKNMADICKEIHVGLSSEDIYFADKMFGILMNNTFEPTDRMKKGFWYDNGIADRKEMPIWE